MPVYLDLHRDDKKTSEDLPKSEEAGLRVRVVVKLKARGRRGESYCILDAPDKETILRYHLMNGLRCDWIEEVTSLQGFGANGNTIFIQSN